MNKLLTKQFNAFTIYALVVLACSIPVYFIIVDKIWLEELDEHNKIIAVQTQAGLDSLRLAESEIPQLIQLWNKTRPGSMLTPASTIKEDSTYEITRSVGFASGVETDRFRGLETYIVINKEPYRLTVETNVEESDETIAAIAVITVIFFIVLVLGFVVLNKRLSGAIWRPFYDTLNKLRDFDLNSKQALGLNASGIAEFEELNQVLLRLIEKNSAIYNEQKEFTENASHELQTPLAIIQSKLDLLLQTKELTAQQSELVEHVNRTLNRMSRINKNLLLLTKIDNEQYQEQEAISVNSTAQESMKLLTGIIDEKELIATAFIEAHVVVHANRLLLEILVNNLLSNAIRHNNNSGRIILTLSEQCMEVRNSGLKPLDETKLYRRFSGVETSNAGSGLGLAIAKQICLRYGWKLDYRFHEGFHCFSVSF